MDGLPDAAEVLDVGAFDVEWFGEGGEVRLPLSRVVEVAFEDVAPVRDFP
jgi:hypothetical protein